MKFYVWFVREAELEKNNRFNKPMGRTKALETARNLLAKRGKNTIREVLIKGTP